MNSLDLLPTPFAWIDIPGKGYNIAKYPVTNAQFAKFIEAGGYQERKWWTDLGWSWHEKNQWTQPRFWTDPKWNGAEQPVVGVSWFEAVAFCLWLSDITNEKIMLPTEDQWQYAAQGDDGRIYPWGNDWDGTRCNNNVDRNDIGRTTPVRQYEGKGDSPFGMVDVAGNIWEWCFSDYITRSNGADISPLRGGSCRNLVSSDFCCTCHREDYALVQDDLIGFRISRKFLNNV